MLVDLFESGRGDNKAEIGLNNEKITVGENEQRIW